MDVSGWREKGGGMMWAGVWSTVLDALPLGLLIRSCLFFGDPLRDATLANSVRSKWKLRGGLGRQRWHSRRSLGRVLGVLLNV